MTTYTNETQRHVSPWIMWALAAGFYFYECLLQVSPGVMVPELMHAFNVDATALGNLAAFYFYAYAGMQIPVGLLLDRFGPRKLLTLASLICMLGCLLFGVATVLGVAKLGRLLIGIGSAFAVVGTMKLAAIWFRADRFSLLTGMLVTIGSLGSVSGQKPLALLVNNYQWRGSMLILAATGGVLAILIWFLVREKNASSNVVTPTHTTKKNFSSGLFEVLRGKQNWLVAIYGGLMFAPTSAFGALWGVPFLIEKFHIDRPAAANVISLLFIGWVIGSTTMGWISDKLQRRMPTMIVGSIISLIIIYVIIYVDSLSLSITGILLLLFGVFSSGFLPAFSIIREINTDDHSATALGFMNTLNMVGGAALQPLIGWFLDISWHGQLVNQAREYSLHSYQIGLSTLPICMLTSIIILPFIRETYCKFIDAPTHN